MLKELRFGFLPEPSCYSGGGLLVEPLENFRECVSALWSSGRVDGTWLNPPLVDKKGCRGFGDVKVEAKVYTVTETHTIRPAAGNLLPDDDICHLVIAVIGFLNGLRLIPAGWNHFYRTPIQVGFLVDFYCADAQIGEAVHQTVTFAAQRAGSQIPERMFAALHWHLTSQSYDQEFEIFSAQYVVLDTCWWIFNSGQNLTKVGHAERILRMCDFFGIPVPPWAALSGKQSFLSILRNEMLHGGYFGKAPIGFDFPDEHPDIDIELKDLNSRLLIALLGLKSPYLQTSVGNGRSFNLSFQ